MNVNVPKGKYVLAVSGGVDSVVLLDLLAGNNDLDIVVAHFDHGIREDSAQDENFVRELASKYGAAYVNDRAELGQGASEEVARDARYAFLRKMTTEHQADKIITAHHQDDLLETMILNMLRGTGRRGLDPLLSSDDIHRPLLEYSKQDLLDYALSHGLIWREDSSNQDMKYRRNAVRQTVVPRLGYKRGELLNLNTSARHFNAEITKLLTTLDGRLLNERGNLIRQRFVVLPHSVAAEYIHWWLTKNGVKNIDRAVVTRATIAAKTLPIGKKIDLGNGLTMHSSPTSLEILPD